MNAKKKINLIVIIVFVLVFVKLAMLVGEYGGEKEADLELAVRLNFDGDFPNPKEGTAVFNGGLLMDQIILNFKKVPKYIIFMESKVIPGLVLRYNVHDSKLEAGLPLMQSEEIIFLDGNIHEFSYTFKEGLNQKIFFDGKEVASGDFNPDRVGIIGAAAYELEGYDIQTMDVDGSMEILGNAR